MSFNIGNAIAGAITGFIEGGPAGAAALGIAGGFSSAPPQATLPTPSGDSIVPQVRPADGASDPLSGLGSLLSLADLG